jgi:MFS family permease
MTQVTSAQQAASAVPAGTAAWRPLLAWSLASLFFCYGFVQRVSPSVMVAELMHDFSATAVILGNLSAFYFYAYAALQIPVGLLMDRIGPRRLMTAAVAVAAAGSVLFAASEAITGAYFGRLLIGAGAAFSWVGVLTVLTQWFPARRFALFTGMAQAVGMAGAIFGQAPLAVSVEQIGWRSTLLVLSGIGFAIAVGIWLVVRDKQHEAATSDGIGASLKVLLRNRETWLNAVFGLSMTAPMLAFAALWAVPYLTTLHGIDRAGAAGVVSFMFVGWAIGAPVMGWLSDRIGARKPVMLIGALVNIVTFLAAIQLPWLPLSALSVVIFVNGLGASAMVLGFACAREHNPPQMSSTAMSIVNVAVIGSGALFQPLVGLLLDLQWNGALADGVRVYSADAFRVALSQLSIAGLCGLGATLLMKESLARQPA